VLGRDVRETHARRKETPVFALFVKYCVESKSFSFDLTDFRVVNSRSRIAVAKSVHPAQTYAGGLGVVEGVVAPHGRRTARVCQGSA
jgi:hypothetical protein